MRLTVPLEIEIDTTSLKEGENMKLSVSGSLSISGQVFVSGGAADAIAEAVAASVGGAFSIDPRTSAQFGSITDGQSVTTVTENGESMSVSGTTWDETNGAFSLTDGLFVLADAATNLASRCDLYFVVSTTDNEAILVNETGDAGSWSGIFQDASAVGTLHSNTVGSLGDGAALYVNGAVQLSTTRDAVHTLVATGSDVLISVRNFLTDNVATTLNLFGRDSDFKLSGLVKSFVLVDAQDDAGADAIEAQLAARHGITL